MYYPLEGCRFALNPKGSIGNSSYETIDDTIYLLLTNKRDVVSEGRRYFTAFTHSFDRKVGPFNRFIITLTGEIKYHDGSGVVTTEPPPQETLIHHLIVDSVELTDRSYRSPLLAHYVLGLRHPTQFNKLLKAEFDVTDVGSGKVMVVAKDISNETKEQPNKDNKVVNVS